MKTWGFPQLASGGGRRPSRTPMHGILPSKFASARPVRVWIATPLGENGKGGVDRMMDVVRHHFSASPDSDFELRFAMTRGPGRLLWSPFYMLRAIGGLIWLRLRGKLDVAHINISQNGSAIRKLILVHVARVLGAPYILHLHGSHFQTYWEGVSPSFSMRLKAAFSHASLTLVLGSAWAEFIRSKAPNGAIEILPNATWSPPHVRDHEAAHGPPHILFLGRIGERKGVAELVDALGMLEPGLAWRATIAGDGDVEGLRAQLAKAGLGDRAVAPGWVGPEEVRRLLGDADILVLPSHDENLPLSVIEGMAHGLAVVTTPVGAVPDIITHGHTGLLVPPRESAALAQALDRVVRNPDLRASLGAAARQFHTERLNAEAYVARLKTLWRSTARNESGFASAARSFSHGEAR